jgi:hypothetical protein
LGTLLGTLRGALPSAFRGSVKARPIAIPTRRPKLGDLRRHPQADQRGTNGTVNVAGTGIRMRPQDRSDTLVEYGAFLRRQLVGGGQVERHVVVG